ncbi:MAG: translation factor GTPase family protein [Olegusella sp.]|nr:translation factor GTPase family protein [Olegusella sp.]
MKEAVVGIVAHVDAGKTTLAEALLYRTGVIRSLGRVDHGDSHLDTDSIEQERGITIFSSQATIEHAGTRLMFVDTPGHVDFSAETERALWALDYAVLIVAGNDGVQGHTQTLWRLLERYQVPTFVFVNKMDLATSDRDAVLRQLQRRLSSACVDFSSDAPQVQEMCAMTEEGALDEYLETGGLSLATMRRLVAARKVYPCFFGSALQLAGVDGFLDGLAALVDERAWPGDFAARVYKVSHDERGERLAWVKVTGGVLSAKMQIAGMTHGEPWTDKVNQVRRYTGKKYELVPQAAAGEVCAVTGLSQVAAGTALGAEPADAHPALEPVLVFRVLPGDCDAHAVYQALCTLAEEDPLLHVTWHEVLQEIRLQLMGAVQLEIVRQELADRFGLAVSFGPGSILYRETITEPVAGVGHFEPLRHYAEVHLLLKPLPRGAGVQYGSACSEDDLDRNWQRLILTNAMERDHLGVLTGAPITDVRITLTAGRAHAKHTEGGDFRQATYRAIRQGLMEAREAGACQLLEPWYRFRLEVPDAQVGRALADLQRMSADFGAPAVEDGFAVLEGTVPASETGEYALRVSSYTGGKGHFSLAFDGYRPCHDADRVIAEDAYEPEADLPHTPDSVFCAHGAGYTVKWYDVPAAAHVSDDPSHRTPFRPADKVFFGK